MARGPLALDRLALAVHYADYQFYEREFAEPPRRSYDDLRAMFSKKLPELGYYNLASSVTTEIGTAGCVVGDAIDDFADIARDLFDVSWRWANTSQDDALWEFKNSFESHWGEHLRQLQCYLHARRHE